MSNPMRQQLVGYLIDALESDERQEVEEALETDVELRRELELLHRSIEPLKSTRQHYSPPAGLAARACRFVLERTEVIPAALSPISASERGSSSRWTIPDMAVAAGIVVAAGLLFLPALNSSRMNAQLASCENNINQVGMALTKYAENNSGEFPLVPLEGKLAVGGMYAPTLVSREYLPADGRYLVCPADIKRNNGAFRALTLEEVEQADIDSLPRIQRDMGGSYSLTLGYMRDGEYRAHRSSGPTDLAMLADTPEADGSGSHNHGGQYGQTVWFKNGKTAYAKTCHPEGQTDHIFQNKTGRIGPGVDEQDVVITGVPLNMETDR